MKQMKGAVRMGINNRKVGFCAMTIISSLLFSCIVSAKPSTTIVSLTERVESHSKTTNMNSRFQGNEIFLYSILSISRKLDTAVTGSLSYVNKSGIKDSGDLSDTGMALLSHQMTSHWKGNYSYSFIANASKTLPFAVSASCIPTDPTNLDFSCGASDSDFISIGYEFNSNPKNKFKHTYKYGLTYNTGSDFSSSRSVSPKFAFRSKVSKKLGYELAYQMNFGLNESINPSNPSQTIGNDILTNRYSLMFDYKLKRKDRLQIGYIFVNNRYFGNQGDDNVARLTYTHIFRMPEAKKHPKAEDTE